MKGPALDKQADQRRSQLEHDAISGQHAAATLGRLAATPEELAMSGDSGYAPK
jgi:hypothetical protein